MEARTIDSIGNYSQVMSEAQEKYGVDPETGFASEIWNSWETNWSGTTSTESTTQQSSTTSSHTFGRGGWINGGSGGPAAWVQQTTTQPIEQDVVNTNESGIKSRSGTQYQVVETFDELSVGDKVISTEIISTVRSRNVEFYAANLKPSTRIYAFFDGKDVKLFEGDGVLPIDGERVNPQGTLQVFGHLVNISWNEVAFIMAFHRKQLVSQ